MKHWFLFLVVFVIAKVGYSSSLIFYDSMLADITDEASLRPVREYLREQGTVLDGILHIAGIHYICRA